MYDEMGISENSLVLTLPSWLLFLCIVAFVILGRMCARKFRNTHDFRKSTKLYLMTAPFLILGFWIMNVPIIMGFGCSIVGFVAMALRSNYFFNHSK